ncbi:hypothetical protein ZWY2020_054724 [Hordeum vulgare]|nr:hypothetical protein ZWY2020_054724 [Hordeum vulgare]
MESHKPLRLFTLDLQPDEIAASHDRLINDIKAMLEEGVRDELEAPRTWCPRGCVRVNEGNNAVSEEGEPGAQEAVINVNEDNAVNVEDELVEDDDDALDEEGLACSFGGADDRGYLWRTWSDNPQDVHELSGKLICSGSDDASLRVWCPKSAQTKCIIEGENFHSTGLACLAITNDSKSIYSCSKDGSVCVVSIELGQVVGALMGHGSTVCCIGISADPGWGDKVRGYRVRGWRIRIWDSVSGARRAIFADRHDGRVLALAVSCDRTTIVSAGSDR